MTKNLAVMHTASNTIITIVETTNPKVAAGRADAERGLSLRSFREVPALATTAEYAIYELDGTDLKFLSDPDRYVDAKYTNYVRNNCPLRASVAVS